MRNLVLATLTLAMMATAQPPVVYTLLPVPNEAPSPRFDGTIAYDPAGKQVFLFGGQDAQGVKNDLWSYSLSDKRWTTISPTGLPPQARLGHTLVFDSARRRLVLFGGQASGFFSDTWAYDIATNAWLQLARDSAGPTRRYGHSAIYDAARDRMVISHGFTDTGRFDDTWSFDLAANAWTNVSPAQNRPLKRCLHHASYDAANGQMYLYGGCSSGFGPCPQADLWAFDLAKNSWTELTPKPSPTGRDHYGMAFDAARAKLVLFGGSASVALNDTWEFDPKLRTWLPATLDGAPPTARTRHESAAANDMGTLLFFGGSTSSGFSNDLWSLAPQKPPVKPMIGSIVNAFSLTGGAVAPGELISIQGGNLGGASVTVNGLVAPIVAASADEIRLQVPYEVSASTQAAIVVATATASSEPFILPVTSVKPGLSMSIFNEDGARNAPDKPALAGSIVTLLVTGHGVTVPPIATGAIPVDGTAPEPAVATSVTIGEREVEILSRGQSADTLGVLRLLVRIPADYPGDAAASVIVLLGAESTAMQSVTIAIDGSGGKS